jgi:hypothetical protein
MLNSIFHLSGKFLVSLKFVGAFYPRTVSLPDAFVLQRIFIGEEEVFCYRHFPLPRFLSKKKLQKWEKEIEESFPSFTSIVEKRNFLSRWIREVETAEWVGIGNYLSIEEAKKETSLLIIYEWRNKRLILGKEAFKPVPDERAVSYLLPCGCFPETIMKLGVAYGARK